MDMNVCSQAGKLTVEQRRIHVDELKKAQEAFVVSGCDVVSLVSWNGSPVGNGKPGPLVQGFASTLLGDIVSGSQ